MMLFDYKAISVLLDVCQSQFDVCQPICYILGACVLKEESE